MFHLRLFASPSLELDDVALTGRAVQRHRVALLALLAVAPGRRLSRDKLIAHLWPESDTEKGRNLLKTTTYVLRSELGEAAVISENDQLRLNEQIIRCDAADFDRAIAQGDLLGAVELYRGPFLDGFFLSDSPSFEEWAAAERARYATQYATSLETLAHASETAKDFVAAAEWWRKRAAHDPYDTRTALRLIRALDAAGNSAGALQYGTIHTQLLRGEFGMEAPAELSSLLDEIRQRVPEPGVEASDVESVRAAVSDAHPLDEKVVETPSAPRHRAYRAWASAAALVIVALGVIYGVSAMRARAAEPESAVAVMPFVNMSGDSAGVYFSDGLSEQIISVLSRIPGLRVAARTSSFALRDSKLDIRAISDTLNVNAVLEGSVRRQGNRMRVTAQLIDARTGYHIWSGDYDREVRQIVEVQDEIATEIARALELRLPTRAAPQNNSRSPSPQAYDFYLRALYLRDTFAPDALRQAIQYLERAIELDPNFAGAYALKATVLGPAIYWGFTPLESGVAEARSAVARALELDPRLGDAYGALGMVKLFFEYDFPAAHQALQRAVELNPNDSHAWHHLGNYYRAVGMPHEAVRARERAAGLDPLNIRMGVSLADDYVQANRFDDALAQYRRVMRLNPAHPMLLGTGPSTPNGPWSIYLKQGRHQEVVDEFLRIASMRHATTNELEELRAAYRRGGLAMFWPRWLEFETRQSGGDPDPVRVAVYHALAGDTEKAIESLERAHAERNPAMIYVFFEPTFAALREHPRFRRIFEQMNFPMR